MDCTQDIDATQSYFESSKNNSAVVAGWIEILGSTFELNQGSTKLGRDAQSCKIVLTDQKTISKEHALFEVENCSVTVCDLNSRNKSKLNHMYLKPDVRYALQGDEKLIFGDVSAKFIKNEKAEIDSDSDTFTLSQNTDMDKSDSVYVPETPTREINLKNPVIIESPIPESQDCFAEEIMSALTEDGNKEEQRVGIVCSMSKMPKISEEYDSDESTDIEDFLESYKVSQSPTPDSKTSDEKDLENGDFVDNKKSKSPESVDMLKATSPVLSNSSTDSDIYSISTQPLNSFQPRSTIHEDEHYPKFEADSPGEVLGALKKHKNSLGIVCEAEKFNVMETSQSLLKEIPSHEQSPISNETDSEELNNISYDPMEELFTMVKFEKESQPIDSPEFQFPPFIEQSVTVPLKEETSHPIQCDIFDAATQVSDIGTVSMKTVSNNCSPLTHVKTPVNRQILSYTATDLDSTQDVLDGFNKKSHNSNLDESNYDSTQAVLNAFSNNGKQTFKELSAENRPIKVRMDLVTAADNCDLPTQPVLMDKSINITDVSTDEEGEFIMPTQVFNFENTSTDEDEDNVFIMPTQVSKFDTKSVSNSPTSCNVSDVFDLPTQVIGNEIRNETAFVAPIEDESPEDNTAISTSQLQDRDHDALTQVIHFREDFVSDVNNDESDNNANNTSVECLEKTQIFDDDMFMVPTQTFIPLNHVTDNIETTKKSREILDNIHNAVTQNIIEFEEIDDAPSQSIMGGCSDDYREPIPILQQSKDDLVIEPTQIYDKNKQDVEHIEGTLKSTEMDDDIFDAPTQIFPTENCHVKAPTNDMCIDIASEPLQISSFTSEVNTSELRDSLQCLSDEDTDIEDELRANCEKNKIMEKNFHAISDNRSLEDDAVKVTVGGVTNLKEDEIIENIINSSTHSNEIEIEKFIQSEKDVVTSALNNSSFTLNVCSAETSVDLNTSCDVENIASTPKLTEEIAVNVIATSEIKSVKHNELGNKSIKVIVTDNEDFSGFDSSPTNWNRSKSLQKIKSIAESLSSINSETESSDNEYASCDKQEVGNNNILEDTHLGHEKKVTPSAKVSPTKVKEKGMVNIKTPKIVKNKIKPIISIDQMTNSKVDKRPIRRPKPCIRYSPEKSKQSAKKNISKSPINQDSQITIKDETSPEIEKPISQNIIKRSQWTNIVDKRFKAAVIVTKLETKVEPTRKSSRKAIQRLDDPAESESSGTSIIVKEVDEILISESNSFISDKSITTNERKKLVPNKGRTISPKVNTRSAEKCSSQIKQKTTSPTKSSRRGGQPEKSNSQTNSCNIPLSKESFSNVSVSLDNIITIPKMKQDIDHSPIIEMSENVIKSNISNEHVEINSRLTRKRSSSEISLENTSAVCGRRKSARFAAKNVPFSSNRSPKIEKSDQKKESNKPAKVKSKLKGKSSSFEVSLENTSSTGCRKSSRSAAQKVAFSPKRSNIEQSQQQKAVRRGVQSKNVNTRAASSKLRLIEESVKDVSLSEENKVDFKEIKQDTDHSPIIKSSKSQEKINKISRNMKSNISNDHKEDYSKLKRKRSSSEVSLENTSSTGCRKSSRSVAKKVPFSPTRSPEIEQSQQQKAIRKGVQTKNVNTRAASCKLPVIEKSVRDVSLSEENRVDFKETKQDTDHSPIIKSSKRNMKSNDHNEDYSKLKRKRSSSEVSLENTPSTGCRKSSRSVAKKVPFSPTRSPEVEPSDQGKESKTRGQPKKNKNKVNSHKLSIKESCTNVSINGENKMEQDANNSPINNSSSNQITPNSYGDINSGLKLRKLSSSLISKNPLSYNGRRKSARSAAKLIQSSSRKSPKIEKTKPDRGAKRRCQPTKNNPSTKLAINKDSINNISIIKENSKRLDVDPSPISESSKIKIKTNQSKDHEEINSKLTRKMSSSSVCSDTAPCSDRRKSTRSLAHSIPSDKTYLSMLASSCQVPKVMFTGFMDERDEEIVTTLGGQLVDNVKDCTVLVTTALKRTCKLLAALGSGVTILSPKWLTESKKAGYFLDTMSYFVSDKQAENKFGFTLLGSHIKARSTPLFHGYSIHATKSVKPMPGELKEIVECAKGNYLRTAPKKFSKKVIIVSCTDDKKSWTAFKKLKLPVVGIEFILTGLLKQKILIDENILF